MIYIVARDFQDANDFMSSNSRLKVCTDIFIGGGEITRLALIEP